MALNNAARRAIAIRNSVARKASTPVKTKTPANDMHPRLLAMCVEAAGFDQNQRFA